MPHRRTYLFAAVAAAVLLIAGCAQFDEWTQKNQAAIEKGQEYAQVVGNVADPATGGISGLAVSLAIAVFNGIVAINRQVVLNKQKKVAAEQAAAAAAVVKSIDVAKAAGAIQFSSQLTDILDEAQGDAGKAFVDGVQSGAIK